MHVFIGLNQNSCKEYSVIICSSLAKEPTWKVRFWTNLLLKEVPPLGTPKMCSNIWSIFFYISRLLLAIGQAPQKSKHQNGFQWNAFKTLCDTFSQKVNNISSCRVTY